MSTDVRTYLPSIHPDDGRVNVSADGSEVTIVLGWDLTLHVTRDDQALGRGGSGRRCESPTGARILRSPDTDKRCAGSGTAACRDCALSVPTPLRTAHRGGPVMNILTLDGAGATLATIHLGEPSESTTGLGGYFDAGDLSATAGNLYLNIDGKEYGSLFFFRQPNGTTTITLGAMNPETGDWDEVGTLAGPVKYDEDVPEVEPVRTNEARICETSGHDWREERDGTMDGEPAYVSTCADCGKQTPRYTPASGSLGRRRPT